MLQKILQVYKTKKELLHYFALTYVDKIISFALPLSVLFVIKDRQLYTFIEVVFSYAAIAVVVAELGFCNYLFYGYKQAANKEQFIQKASQYFRFLLFVYGVLTVALLVVVGCFDRSQLGLFILVSIRLLFTLYVTFYSNIYRLNDKPSGIYVVTVTVNVLSFVLLMLAQIYNWPYKVYYFFMAPALLVAYPAFLFLSKIREFVFRDFFEFLSEALRYSWPIILNVLAMNYIGNYAKIYAYDRLSTEEAVEISYIMRVGLIIQLTHASFSAFFSKSIFMDEKQEVNFRMLKRYTAVILFSALIVACIIAATNLLFPGLVKIALAPATFMFVLYIILWCYIAYFEIYFGIFNANRRILIYSVVSSLVYTAMLKLSGSVNLLQLSIFMVITAALNLGLVLWGLRRIGALKPSAGQIKN